MEKQFIPHTFRTSDSLHQGTGTYRVCLWLVLVGMVLPGVGAS
jgi:hypothetical protein